MRAQANLGNKSRDPQNDVTINLIGSPGKGKCMFPDELSKRVVGFFGFNGMLGRPWKLFGYCLISFGASVRSFDSLGRCWWFFVGVCLKSTCLIGLFVTFLLPAHPHLSSAVPGPGIPRDLVFHSQPKDVFVYLVVGLTRV